MLRMSFGKAFVGQIAFPAKHPASASVYALGVSPVLDWIPGLFEKLEATIVRW